MADTDAPHADVSDDVTTAHPLAQPAAGTDPVALAKYALARYHALDDAYTGLYETWAKAILFLIGRHYVEWNAKQRRFTRITDVPPWRSQPQTNLTYATYRAALAKLTKQRPALDVVPASGDSEDREAAKLGEAVLHHLWRLLRLQSTNQQACGWMLATGNVYWRVSWDPDAGEVRPLTTPVEREDPLTGMPQLADVPADEDLEPLEEGAEPVLEPIGECKVTIVSPLFVRLNPEATSDADATEYYVGYLCTREDVAKRYGVETSEVPALEDETVAQYDALLAAAVHAFPDGTVSQQRGLGSDLTDAMPERTLVLEFYARPDAEHPGGRHWVQAIDAMLVEEQALPDGFWPPLIPMRSTPVPGSPHALGMLGTVVPLNEQYNHANAKIDEHHTMMATGGKWIVAPDDQGLRITTDPGQVLKSKGYANGRPPIQAKPVALPAEVYAERDRILKDAQFVSGLGEVGLSQKPEGVSSGRGFLVLQEQVDSVFTPDLLSEEEALQEVGRRLLVLVQRNYREERTIKVRGEKGQWEFRSFRGADLRDGLDVQVQVGSSFPWSKSARLDTALQMLTQLPGLVTDPATGIVDATKVAKVLDVGGLQAFTPEGDPDLIEVQREHALFEAYDPTKGEQELPELGFWQNHAAHYDAHADFLKTERGRFSRWHPEAQRAFLAHVLETHQTIDAQVASVAPPTDAGMTDPAVAGTIAPAGAPGAAPPAPAGAAGVTPKPGAQPQRLTTTDRRAAGV